MEQKHFESLYPADSHSEEIGRILHLLKEGNSCQVVGVPGVGRANLSGLLAYNKEVRIKHLGDHQKWMHFVVVNFSEIRGRVLFDAMKFLFLSLLDSLRERDMLEAYEKVYEEFKESLQLQDELVLFQGMKKTIDYLAIEKELTVVFLFEHFDEYIPSVTNEFFANLRILRDRAKYRFAVVFSLNRPLEDILEPSLFSDFYEYIAGKIVYINLYDKPSVDFRVGYLEKVTGKKVPEKVLADVISLTAGHGKLTTLCMETVLAQDNSSRLHSNNNLAGFLLEQKIVRKALFDIYNSLSPSEQKWLVSKEGEEGQEESIKQYLTAVGLLKRESIAMPLLEELLKQKFHNTYPEKDKIVFDEKTNAIYKGYITLSERLTGAEYRLLRYLLENQDRVIERDEIVDVVWKDAKSTAGVTDQAVDQLIFRLRKKIEDNPNVPEHLQTVKGRGFKFVP